MNTWSQFLTEVKSVCHHGRSQENLKPDQVMCLNTDWQLDESSSWPNTAYTRDPRKPMCHWNYTADLVPVPYPQQALPFTGQLWRGQYYSFPCISLKVEAKSKWEKDWSWTSFRNWQMKNRFLSALENQVDSWRNRRLPHLAWNLEP